MAFKDKKADTEYKNKYSTEHYDRINLTVPKGAKEEIRSAADKAGQSVNGFIWSAIQDRMK